MNAVLFVAMGGALGAALRYGIGQWLAFSAPFFPFGTLACNVLGSFAMGCLIAHGLNREPGTAWLVFGVGFLGAFTTWSAFSGETVTLLQERQVGLAMANTMVNLFGTLAACFAGIAICRALGSGA